MLTYIFWNPDPIIFTLGPFAFRWYGLTWAIGTFCAYLFFQYIHRSENKDVRLASRLFEYLFIGSLLGARLGAVIFYELDYFLQNPLEIFQVWKGGLASHGGGIGMILAILLFIRRHPQYSFWWILDRLSIITFFGAGIVRLGNLMNSEIVGKPTTLSWAFIFEKVDELPRHPSTLYEAIFSFALFALLFNWYRQGKYRGAGCLTGWGFVLGFTGRTLLEFFKESALTTQLLNIPFILVGLYLIFRCRQNAVN